VRASTFFAIFIALILGFAGIAAAKYFHLFSPPPVVERKAEPLPKVLVAKRNLLQGFAMTQLDVMVRELNKDEVKDYQDNPTRYLPPMLDAAAPRVLNKDINAGQPLLYEYLLPIDLPPGVSNQLREGMRAVRVNLMKDFAEGGLIRVGDNVDVYLTSKISANGTEFTKSAPIALAAPVLFKRDTLYNVLVPLPEDKPIQFTLETDPYRAALIEFAGTRGQLSLVSTNAQPRPKDPPRTFNNPNSKEYRNEDERIAELLGGTRSIGDPDLERIFNLPPIIRRENVQVVMLKGNKIVESTQGAGQFTEVVTPPPASDPDQPNYGYHFSYPPAHPAEPVAKEAPRAPAVQMRSPVGAGAKK
jgi:Flp pilus assembly protein CpaB